MKLVGLGGALEVSVWKRNSDVLIGAVGDLGASGKRRVFFG